MLAIIGGSGLSSLKDIKIIGSKGGKTPYGRSSEPPKLMALGNKKFVFLPRHGSSHSIAPHEINYRANIWALSEAGVKEVISITAVGGVNRNLLPGDIILPDQLIDYTHGRKNSFYDGIDNELRHMDFTWPYDWELRKNIKRVAQYASIPIIDSGVYAATQGPRLETAAEIDRLEKDGATIVGMTGMPEAYLARELNIPYVTISVVANHAAGRGESLSKIEVDGIDRVMKDSLDKVIFLLKEYIAS